MRAALIVAGGRSTRFGEADKAVADLAGVPMIRRVVERLAPAVDELVVNGRADQRDEIEDALDGVVPTPAYAEDPEPDLGPMAGMAAGLRAVESTYALVVACDMPFVDREFGEYLFERVQGHDAAVPRPDEWFQTTQAVYRADATAAACRAALDRGDRRIVDALSDLDYVTVDAEEIEERASSRTFENLNTRQEFEAAAESLGE